MAAVNSATYSSLSDQLVAEALDPQYILLVAERNNFPQHPAIMIAQSIEGSGSATRKVGHVGLMGYDIAAAMADGGVVPLTAISDGSTTIAVTRQTKAYGATDLARMALPDGRLNPEMMALDAVRTMNGRATDMICDVIDGFPTQAGPGTGVDLDVASVMAVIGAAAVNNVAGSSFMGVLHGQQWADLIVDGGTSIGAASGGTQNYNPELARLQNLNGSTGYVGSWLGVDWYRNNRVKSANSGADRAGALFGYGGVIGCFGMFRGVEDPTNQVLLGGTPDGTVPQVLLERVRDAFAGETAFVMHCYMGWSLGVPAGITIISDL